MREEHFSVSTFHQQQNISTKYTHISKEEEKKQNNQKPKHIKLGDSLHARKEVESISNYVEITTNLNC